MDPTSGVRKQDGGDVVSSVASNKKVGHYLAWSWVRLKWPAISDYFDASIR